MARRIAADEFKPASTMEAANQAIVIHGRPAEKARALVLFVHGLNGSRYKTWEQFPGFVFERYQADVGLFQYATGWRRIRRPFAPDIAGVARHLAAELCELDQYPFLVLVGHSLGGLLASGVVKRLIEVYPGDRRAEETLGRLVGLFLYAAPLGGSARVPLLGRFSADGRALHAFSAYADEVARRLGDWVDLNSIGADGEKKRFHIPAFAAQASDDPLVPPLSARLGVPPNQVTIISGSHTSIVKPRSAEDRSFQWFSHHLDDCLAAEGLEPADFRRTAKDIDASPESETAGGPPAVRLHVRLDDVNGIIEQMSRLRLENGMSIDIEVVSREGEV